MPAVSVRAVTPIWSLDRDLDYLVEDAEEIKIGQRVLVPLGKQKSLEVALVTAVMRKSPHATRPIDRVLKEPPIVSEEHIAFLEQVARRYCVSLGEILGLAIPDFMPRAAAAIETTDNANLFGIVKNRMTSRTVIVTKARSEVVAGELMPDWVDHSIRESLKSIASGLSVLICVPEQSDVKVLTRFFELLAPETPIIPQMTSETKSQRYLRFRKIQNPVPKVAIVTRSGILWQVANLGKVILHDDLDESLRDPGSPFYSAWEVALLRSSEKVDVVFLAAYRSAQLQRLVEMGYLKSMGVDEPIRDIEFSRPDELGQKSIIPFLRKCIRNGTALVLTTRKGSNSSVHCQSCGIPRTCGTCNGSFWVNPGKSIECRVCTSEVLGNCKNCGEKGIRLGKLGASRIAADIGKAIPGVRVVEIEAEPKHSVLAKSNQIVVATTGSAPYLREGYSGLVVFDSAAWQGSSHPTAELVSHRDWLGAIELLKPSAPVYLRNIDSGIAQKFVLGRFIETSNAAVASARGAGLYPESKYFRIECDPNSASELADLISAASAEVLKVITGDRSIIVGRVPTNKSLALADAIRPWVKIQKPSRANPKRRPVAIEFDFEAWR